MVCDDDDEFELGFFWPEVNTPDMKARLGNMKSGDEDGDALDGQMIWPLAHEQPTKRHSALSRLVDADVVRRCSTSNKTTRKTSSAFVVDCCIARLRILLVILIGFGCYC